MKSSRLLGLALTPILVSCALSWATSAPAQVTVRLSDGTRFLPGKGWTQEPYYGSRGTFFADVTGDGRADAIVVNDDTVTVRRSDGTRFLPNEDWTHGPFFGERGTFFADVTGDGKADAIIVTNKTVIVRRSDGTQFLAPEDWTHGPYFGNRGTFFVDVTGDGRADAIVVNDDTVTTRRSLGFEFSRNEDWTQGPYFGRRGTFFADVSGDGKADAIVVNDDTVTVRRSFNSQFLPNEDWTHGPYFGQKGIFFADVTRGGTADAIVVNDDTITVRRALNSEFQPNQDWTHGPYYGDRGTFFADVDGDGRADAIVVNGNASFPPSGLGIGCPDATNDTSFDLERHGVLAYRSGNIRVVNLFWASGWDNIREHQPQGNSPGFLRADINAGTKALIASNFFARACQYGAVPYVFSGEGSSPWGSANACSGDPGSSFTLVDLYALASCLEVSEGTPVPHAGGAPTPLLTGGGVCMCGTIFTPIPCFIDPACLAFPNGTGNLLLNVFIPANRKMTDSRPIDGGHGQVPSEAEAFLALSSQGRPIYVAYYFLDRLIARGGGLGSVGVGELLNLESHEMVESLTNPNTGFWFDDQLHKITGETEVADYCVESAAPLQFGGTHIVTANMQSYWSNGDNACVSVDDLPPHSTINLFPNGTSGAPARVLITAEDLPADRVAKTDQDGTMVAVRAAVGVRSITYFTDTGIGETTSTAIDASGRNYAEFVIVHSGITHVTFFATDLLGNREISQTVSVFLSQ